MSREDISRYLLCIYWFVPIRGFCPVSRLNGVSVIKRPLFFLIITSYPYNTRYNTSLFCKSFWQWRYCTLRSIHGWLNPLDGFQQSFRLAITHTQLCPIHIVTYLSFLKFFFSYVISVHLYFSYSPWTSPLRLIKV